MAESPAGIPGIPTIGTIGDVQAALRASEDRLEVAAQVAGVAVFDWDLATDRMMSSPEFYRLHGVAPGTSPTSGAWIATIHPDDRAWVQAGIAALTDAAHGRPAVTSDAGAEREYRIVLPDGAVRWIASRVRVVCGDDGRPVRVLGADVDITARKRLEQERERLLADVEAERSRLREIFEASPSFFAVTRGPDHVFEYVNEAYYRMVGRRELLGQRVFDVFPEGVEQGYGDIRHRVLEDGRPFVGRELPLMVRSAAGWPWEQRFVDLTFIPVTEPDGTRSGIILHGIDVTAHVLARREVERLLAEAERVAQREREARAAAESAGRERDHVLSIVSHDLRTPLSTIAMCARALSECDEHSESVPRIRDLIDRCVAWMNRMIRDLSDVASLEAGHLAVELRDEDPAAVVAAATELFTAAARSGGVALEARTDAGIPVIRADADRLLQALANLVTNALEYTARGGRVTLGAETAEGCVRFIVDDTGTGISADDLPHVFDRYWHKRPGASRHSTGLGLAITRGIVEAHGGRLQVESAAGEGTRFSFTIPTAEPAH